MNNYQRLADKRLEDSEALKLNISFKYIDWEDEYFFLQGLKNKHFEKIFATLEELKNTTLKSFREQTAYNLTPKSIFHGNGLYTRFHSQTYNLLKNNLQGEEDIDEKVEKILKQAFEIRISKNYGRIHGFLLDNTFYIVWFDPAHNLYYGRKNPIKMKDYATVREFSQDEIEKLQEQISELYDLLEEKTCPENKLF